MDTAHDIGRPNNLDALCRRYGVDNSKRTKHGALLDAELLADVYLEMIGGKQTSFGLVETTTTRKVSQLQTASTTTQRPRPLPSRLSETELADHEKAITSLGHGSLWKN